MIYLQTFNIYYIYHDKAVIAAFRGRPGYRGYFDTLQVVLLIQSGQKSGSESKIVMMNLENPFRLTHLDQNLFIGAVMVLC